MPSFAAAIRANKIPVIGLVPETSATAPSAPVVGQLWTDTTTTPRIVRVWDGAVWAPLNIYAGTTADSYAAGNDARITGAEQTVNKGAANGYASLDGTTKVPLVQLPTGTGATNVITGDDARLTNQRVPTDASVTGGVAGAGVKIAANTITHDNVAAANRDGVAGTPSMRTLGTTATSAAAGNDPRLSDMRVPTDGSVTGGTAGTGVKIAANTITLANLAASTIDAAAATGSLRTLGTTGTSAMAGNRTLDTISQPVALMNFNGQRLTNIGAPTANTDAARLVDVQGAAAGLDAKPSVRAASTGNIAIATGLVNGTVIDGVTLATGDRVLLKNQTTTTENGPYIVAASGAAARASDSLTPNSFWFAEEGTVNADTQWIITTNGTITVGTTGITISQFGAATNYTGTSNRITVTGTVIDISSAYVGQTSITTLGTITTGTWNGTSIAVGFGGTGATTAAAARTNLNTPQRGFAADLGAVTAGTAVTVTHNLGTQDVIAQVRETATNEAIFLDITNSSTNAVSIRSDLAYAAGALRVVVLPVA